MLTLLDLTDELYTGEKEFAPAVLIVALSIFGPPSPPVALVALSAHQHS